MVGKGHPIGDQLEAHAWEVLERKPGKMRVRARPPRRLMNPRGDLYEVRFLMEDRLYAVAQTTLIAER